jgi:hypothetical protein
MVGVVSLIYRFCSSRKYVIHRVTAGELFTISTYTSVFYFQFRWVTATVVLCGLFLQGCKSGVHAIIEEAETQPTHKIEDHECSSSRVLAAVSGTHTQSSSLSCEYSDAHSQLVLAASPPSEPLILCPPSAAVLAPGIAQILASPARATGMPHVQFSSKFFTTSSGERVSFRKEGSKWQAILQPGTGSCIYQRALPVVSAEAIETLLKNLHGQDIWASRSRIHIMATAHPAHTPFCVYLGKCGLLGGMPVQHMQPTAPKEWHTAPGIMICGSNAIQTKVFHIPPGYRYGGWRLKPGAVIEHASLTVRYVEANSREAIYELVSLRDGRPRNAVLAAGIGKVVELGIIAPSTQCAPILAPDGQQESYFTNAAVVLYGRTNAGGLPSEEGKIDIELEVCIEKNTKIKILDVSEERARLQDEKIQLQLVTDLKQAEDGRAFQTAKAQLEERLNELAQEYASLGGEGLYQTSVPSFAFGKHAWDNFFGEVGAEPQLPANINEMLNASCPFWPERQVKDTHLLVLIPATVDGRPFSLDFLSELIRSPKGGGQGTQYSCYDNDVKLMLGAQVISYPYWILMTRDVISNSRNQTHEDQKALVAACARHIGLPYEMPHALDVATAIVSWYVRTGECLYTDHPCTYTRCQEIVADEEYDEYPVIIGGFTPEGVSIRSCFDSNVFCGTSCCLRF